MDFSSHILQWYQFERRDFPWRSTKNAYKVWLSEIILQQTRTSQGLNYYLKFTNAFPTIRDLAEASENEVLKLWQGLGYYSRARNLHHSAKFIHQELKGVFPNSYKELLKLKGVGPYTAAAISSICFKEVQAAVDGNVYRVLSRVFDVETAINSSKGISQFQTLASQLVSQTDPGDYNQALMDLGATICTPKNPKCSLCPTESMCLARAKNIITERPVKIKGIKIKERHLNYFCLEHDGKFLMKKRTENDIWKNLYDFPLHESNHTSLEDAITSLGELVKPFDENAFNHIWTKHYTHKLSHQKLSIFIHHVEIKTPVVGKKWLSLNREEVMDLPVPKPIEKFFEELLNPLDNKK
jgi:A/G-specific adenine glycosylase